MRCRAVLVVVTVALLLAPAAADDAPPVVATTPAAPDLSGEWTGHWESAKNGHHGPLRATFTRVGPNCYQVKFAGRFAAVVPFRYSTPMTVVGSGDGVVLLSANKTLGPLLGSFSMSATATATTFDADFTAKNDRGKFILARNCGR
ncbi:MAG TPA: hypothetical protein VH092_18105 [Urbifossiella sp.]|jgi:hypothetical protein|nr:hypothetical protein [Urbifossiella sp.]